VAKNPHLTNSPKGHTPLGSLSVSPYCRMPLCDASPSGCAASIFFMIRSANRTAFAISASVLGLGLRRGYSLTSARHPWR
jgi:hypothetical protein